MAVRSRTTTDDGATSQPATSRPQSRVQLVAWVFGVMCLSVGINIVRTHQQSEGSNVFSRRNIALEETRDVPTNTKAWFSTMTGTLTEIIRTDDHVLHGVTSSITQSLNDAGSTTSAALGQAFTKFQDVLLQNQMNDETEERNGNDRSILETSQDQEDDEESSSTVPEQDTTPQKPLNVLVLYPDDLRWDTIGKEDKIVKTPFLDSLADKGMHFRQNAVTSSICWVSRATLFTGQWPSRHLSKKLYCPLFASGFVWKNSSWPAILQKHGYYTGHVGKWQYDSNNDGRFDFSRFFEGRHWYQAGSNKPFITADELARNHAIEFLQTRPKDRPFAMTVAFYPPKPVGTSEEPGGQFMPRNETRALYENITIPEPYNITHAATLLPAFLQKKIHATIGRFRQRYRTQEHYQESMKNMYALITQVDQACKEIVAEIEKQGLLNETMIIFTADNGMFNGAHGFAGKWYPYQESIRVPLIIYDPRMPKSKLGTTNEDFTLNVDLAETILGAAGLPPHPDMQGRNIADLYLEERASLLEKEPWRQEFFYDYDVGFDAGIPSSKALVRKDFKYIEWWTVNEEQLFDLQADPFEFTDVKDRPENQELLKEMRARMAVLQEEASRGALERECFKSRNNEENMRRYSIWAVDPAAAATTANLTTSR